MESATVHTLQDLERETALPRKRKYTSKACSSCRKLKIRCRELADSKNDTPCEHCHKVGSTCLWPEEDARKLGRTKSQRRRNSSSGIVGTPALETKPTAGADVEPTSPDLVSQDGFNIEGLTANPRSAPTSRPNSTETPYTVLQYYRYLGSTAIAPGYKKISLKLANDTLGANDTDNALHDSLQQLGGALFDDTSCLPRAELMPYLLDAFFEYYGGMFCFLNRHQLEGLIQVNEISSFLMCSIAALSARFCSPEVFAPYFPQLANGQDRQRWQYSLPFLSQAKKLLLPLLSIPSCDLVAGLLFLALAEFGDNNEAGMWMFTGMSIRVAQELGLHRQRPSVYSSIGRSPTNGGARGLDNNAQAPFPHAHMDSQTFESSSQILLFWCVFNQDTSLANGTGRVPSIKESEISIRLPTEHDMAVVRAGPGSECDTSQTSAFPQLVRMMLEYARSIEFLNTEFQPVSGFVGREKGLETIEAIRNSILTTYGSIPGSLGYGAKQYRLASDSGQAIPYLMMHLNFHLQIAFLTQACHAIEYYHASSSLDDLPARSNRGVGQCAVRTAQQDLSYENQLYRTAIKSIVDILTIARFIDARPLLSTFFLNQACFHSACAYAGDVLRFEHHSSLQFSPADNLSAFPLPSHSSTSVVFDLAQLHDNPNARANLSQAEAYLALLAKTNYQFLRQTITEMANYYAGAGWVDAVLDQRENGVRDVDLSIVSEHISTYIRLHDLRATHKLSGKAFPIQQTNESNVAYGGDLMLSQDLLSGISPNFDSQAFFNDFIFAGTQLSGMRTTQTGSQNRSED